MDTETNERVLEEAARWHARLAAPDCTDEERAGFERWWLADAAHGRAFALCEAVASAVERNATSDERLAKLAGEAFAMEPEEQPAANDSAKDHPSNERCRPRRVRRWMVPAALAASAAIVAVTVRLAADFEASATPPQVYSTSADSRREITLADGSIVSLDVASEISVRISETERQVVLSGGRALFEVARDPSRPFTVTAGTSRTTALGTRFQVQREGGQVIVTLAEGRVAVSDHSGGAGWRETLDPGEQVTIQPGAREPLRRRVDPHRTTSWSRGRLVFEATPLDEALAEINRYAGRKVRLGDPELASLTVGGNFIAGDSAQIVSAFAAVLPIRVVEGGGELILFRRYEAEVP